MYPTKRNQYPQRTRINLHELMERYPGGVTLTHYKVVETNYGPNIICHIKEDDEIYFFGGKILMMEAIDWNDRYGGETNANTRLMHKGGMHLEYVMEIAPNGKRYYFVPKF